MQKEKYYIYFHNDFDGYAGAAVIYDFLKKQNKKISGFQILDYEKYPTKKWEKEKFKDLPIILDFRYHPKAYFWFDHHPTTFIKKEWKDNFKPTKFHYFDTSFKSCASLIVNKLQKEFNYKPNKFIKKLCYWGDIIDSANFKSPKETIDINKPAYKIAIFLSKNHDKNLIWLIKAMSTKSLLQIANLNKIKNLIKKEKEIRKKALNFYYQNLKIYNNKLAFIDLTKTKFSLRYAPFYLAPQIIYAFSLSKNKKYKISLSANPWQKNKPCKNIGKFLQKFGGGGHKRVGGIEFNTKKEADKFIQKIIKEFS